MNTVYNIYEGYDWGNIVGTAPSIKAAVAFIEAQENPDDYTFERAGAEC